MNRRTAAPAVAGALVTATFAALAFASLPPQEIETPWGTIPRALVEPPGESEAAFGPPARLAPPPPPRPALPDTLPFGVGERLDFSIGYGIINAGGAVMEVREIKRVTGVPCLNIRTEAKSNRFFSSVYKVWDRAQTFLAVDAVVPRRFEKHLREGSYEKDQVIKFDRSRAFASYDDGKQIMMHPYSQDELSAFYYMRTLPLEVGRDIFIDTHSNGKNYPMKIVCHRRETVQVEAGTFDCFVIEPIIREGGIFTAKGRMNIWITTDERRMPVKMNTKVKVGSVTAELRHYQLGQPVVRSRSVGF